MTRRTLVVCLFALSWAAACSWLTKPEQGDLHCKPTEVDGVKMDPCPDGMYCTKSGTCLAEEEGRCKEDAIEACQDEEDNDCDGKVDEENGPETEICDTKDNDCDGRNDEGFDIDGDTWTTCGRTATFTIRDFDCDTDRKEVNPDADEVCDNLDNDCDAKFDEDEDEALCPAGERCLNGRCVVPSCAEPGSGVNCKSNERCMDARCVVQACSPACKTTETCDPVSLTCITPPPKRLGEGCVADNECESSPVKLMCFERAALGLAAGPTRGVCGIGCCTDANCGPNETCYVGRTGGRSCLPKTLIANPATPARCVVHENCSPNNQFCAIGLVNEVGPTICRTPIANSTKEKKLSDTCNESSECASRLCVAANLIEKRCSAPCRDSADCKEFKPAPSLLFDSVVAYCKYVPLESHDASLKGYSAPVCMVGRVGQDVGPGRNGQECYVNKGCNSGVCMGGSGEGRARCSSTCCSDVQCMENTAPGAPATRCQPVSRGEKDRYEMRCLMR
jgi:hypothetical protein